MTNDGRALVGLGSNLPFRGLSGPALLEAALKALQTAGLPVLSVSSAWRSAAWPDPSQPDFVNAVAALDAGAKDAAEIFHLLAEIEVRFGRVRGGERWSARTLDLDLLDLGGRNDEVNGIIIPHPRLAARPFVLVPLREIDPNWVHPASGLALAELLEAVKGQGELHRIGPLRIAQDEAGA